MKEIPLTKGKSTLVDDEDYLRVIAHKWHIKKDGNIWYVRTIIGKKILSLHRFILDAKSDEEVDHINRDGLDNRKANLRFVTKQQNAFNQKKRTNTSSQYKGVRKRKDCDGWEARICLNYKQSYLGLFGSEEEAARAYDIKAIELFGEHARINFPNPHV